MFYSQHMRLPSRECIGMSECSQLFRRFSRVGVVAILLRASPIFCVNTPTSTVNTDASKHSVKDLPGCSSAWLLYVSLGGGGDARLVTSPGTLRQLSCFQGGEFHGFTIMWNL